MEGGRRIVLNLVCEICNKYLPYMADICYLSISLLLAVLK